MFSKSLIDNSLSNSNSDKTNDNTTKDAGPDEDSSITDLDRFNVENDLVQATGNEGEKKVTDEDVKELEE